MEITVDKDKHRYETVVDGHLSVLEFKLTGNVISLDHVRVPEAVGGRGIAGSLTRFALKNARTNGWKVLPNCLYVKKWIERHPEYADLAE